MTRKDYILIAAALKEALVIHSGGHPDWTTHNEGIARAARKLADALARDNPRFDRERFLRAAGVQS